MLPSCRVHSAGSRFSLIQGAGKTWRDAYLVLHHACSPSAGGYAYIDGDSGGDGRMFANLRPNKLAWKSISLECRPFANIDS